MSVLSRPLCNHLAADLDASTIRGMWQGTTRRRRQRLQARHLRALAGLLRDGDRGCAVRRGTCRARDPRRRARSGRHGRHRVEACQRRQLGHPRGARRARAIAFDDGSRVELEHSGNLRALENTDRALSLLLGEGRARFDVHPGGPRRWSIEAGLATVEVVGTRFTVTRTPGEVVIEVEHGIVLVRGERVPDRVQRLTGGQRLVSRTGTRYRPPRRRRPLFPTPSRPDDRTREAPAEPTWHALADKGSYAEAYDTLGAKGIEAQVSRANLEQLLALADVARLSGHPGDAVQPLRRIVAEYASDPRAALAAFTLGRLHLDELGSPATAVRDFREAIGLKLANALLEDAYLRWIEAAAKAGDSAEVRNAYDRYRARFPNSTRQGTAERWAGKR